jgi:dinuclear metal center YbgI/SA1388 family protein
MVTLQQLVYYLDGLLTPGVFKDYAPNGLQVEGRSSINTLVTGVTANQALIDAAIQYQADAILVHHGFFWKNELATLVGMKYRRIKSLILNDISLLAYHLPLDAHLELGNNTQLAKLLHIEFIDTFQVEPGLFLGFKGKLSSPMSGEHFSEVIAGKLGRQPLYIQGGSPFIETIAWCTGAAQDYLLSAAEQGVDAFITGEISERTVHIARENNLHFYAAGHHATERYGIKALGDHLGEEFQLTHYFIDIDNPV